MSFQWIVDNAADVTINKRGVVAQTITRNQTVRSASRGGKVWRFIVTPSPGLKWQDSRAYIEAIDAADRVTPATINFNQAATDYIFGYQGGQSSTAGWSLAVTQGSAIASVSGGSLTPGFRFRAGDLIQLAAGKVYSVVNDVAHDAPGVTLNRPVIENTGNFALTVGRACTWTVICTSMPEYKITPLGFIEWSGPFTFVESLA